MKQEKSLRQWASENNHTLVQVFREELEDFQNCSESKVLTNVREAIATRQFEVLVLASADRLTKEVTELQALFQEFNRAGCVVVCLHKKTLKPLGAGKPHVPANPLRTVVKKVVIGVLSQEQQSAVYHANLLDKVKVPQILAALKDKGAGPLMLAAIEAYAASLLRGKALLE